MAVSTWSGAPLDWGGELAALKARMAPIFRRSELKETAGAFLDGLFSNIGRKTGRRTADQAGLERP